MHKYNSRNCSKFKGCIPLQFHHLLENLNSTPSYYSYTPRQPQLEKTPGMGIIYISYKINTI